MNLGELIEVLMKRGCSVHFGPMPNFMGLIGPNEGAAVVVMTAQGERFCKHYPPDMGVVGLAKIFEASLADFLRSGEVGPPVGEEPVWASAGRVNIDELCKEPG